MQKDSNTAEIIEKVANNQPVQQELQKGYWIQLDLPLPLLIIFHQPEARLELNSLVRGESSYLIVPDKPDALVPVQGLLEEIIKLRAGQYGSFLLLDIHFDATTRSDLKISYYHQKSRTTVATLVEELTSLKVLNNALTITENQHASPQGSIDKLLDQHGGIWVQVSLPRMFAHPEQGESYPVLLRNFRDYFSNALRQALYTFLRVQTNYEITNPRTLGRTTVDDAFWQADQRLYELESSFRFLMLVSATNLRSAWEEFQAGDYKKAPTFYYPILPIDPEERKQALYSIDIDAVHDPALAFILRDKRKELDIQLDMLNERGSENFLYSSIRLYKTIDEELLQLAQLLLEEIPVQKVDAGTHSAEQFAKRVEKEFAYYREQDPKFNTKVHLGGTIPGLMVSHGELYIPNSIMLRQSRVEALIQHEVGTHVLTYYNGSQQPIRLMRLGLADYDELQEGLAVLTEYIIGGLDPLRMRLLAARVVVAYERMRHTSFCDAFALLTEQYGFRARTAFGTVARIYQAGGFTKDLIYLRGFIRVWQHLQQGNSLEPLLMGKIAAKHIGTIQALRERGILQPPAIKPRYWFDNDAQQQLSEFRNTTEITDIVKKIVN
ncbi:MAG: tyrosine/phenylalanine carboxypeptidase domain-containing protein [Tunicatimonas sp.]|uniref:flavohemoglobin expression-modulating QEGLA motif protein n=1 Tax=Tunicatimonas sp. TaxID=1940096 RepID=UPI003C72886A